MFQFKKKSTKELVQGGPVEPPSEPQKKFGFGQKKERPDKPGSRGSFRTMIRTRVFWGTICVIVGLLVPLVGIPMLKNYIVETVDVVRFRTDLKAGSQITQEMLDTVELSAYHLPSGAMQDMSAVVGQYLLVDTVAGDYVTPTRLSPQHPGTDPTLLDLPEGKMALSISLPDLAQSVSGKLRGGDIIQIFAVENSSVNLTASIPAELRYVEVLTATYQDGADVGTENALTDGSSSASNGRNTLATVTLLVNERQAACLAGLEQNATLHAALVIRGNDEKKAAALEAQENFFTSSVDSENEPTDLPLEGTPEAPLTEETPESSTQMAETTPETKSAEQEEET